MFMRELGPKIQTKRKANNLTQTCLAEELKLSRSYISKIETGKIYPSLKTLDRISQVLNVPVEYFF
ncbi:XRE family transcriptional regulator [Bacillus subtilis]|nr:XRE family transcriptional regulator [Bacillus subtilis]